MEVVGQIPSSRAQSFLLHLKQADDDDDDHLHHLLHPHPVLLGVSTCIYS